MNPISHHSKRNSGLDAFRCLSMLFVVVLHLINHGGLGTVYAAGSSGNTLILLIQIAVFPAVNCFMLLSGYLLSDRCFRLARIFNIWFIAVFWSVIIQCFFYVKYPESISAGKTLYMFFPIFSERYWFLNAYVVVLIVSPVLNMLIRDLPRWQLQGLLLSAIFIFCLAPLPALGNDVFKTQNGYSFPWFLTLYIFGGYIKKYNVTARLVTKTSFLLIYILLCLFQLFWTLSLDSMGAKYPVLIQLRNLFFKYTSIPVFCSALCLLLYFSGNKIRLPNLLSRFLEKISPLVFSVYLIHEHPLIRENLIQNSFASLTHTHPLIAFFLLIGIALLIFTACITLDYLRHLLFHALHIPSCITKLSGWLTLKIVSFLKENRLWTLIS